MQAKRIDKLEKEKEEQAKNIGKLEKEKKVPAQRIFKLEKDKKVQAETNSLFHSRLSYLEKEYVFWLGQNNTNGSLKPINNLISAISCMIKIT